MQKNVSKCRRVILNDCKIWVHADLLHLWDLRRTTQRMRRVQLRYAESEYFNVVCPTSRQQRVASGLSVKYLIRFSPDLKKVIRYGMRWRLLSLDYNITTYVAYDCNGVYCVLTVCNTLDMNEMCIPVSAVPNLLLSVLLLVVIWSYPEQGYNSATGHFVWLVRSPGTVYHWTFVRHLHYQRSKTCPRHLFSRSYFTDCKGWRAVSPVRNVTRHVSITRKLSQHKSFTSFVVRSWCQQFR